MQLHSFTALALTLISAAPSLASLQGHGSLRSIRSHVANLQNDALEAVVRDMAEEHANKFLQRAPVTTTCRDLVRKDITDSLTNRQIAYLVNYTNSEILDKLTPGMVMFDVEQFRDNASPNNFSRTVGNWRTDLGYWTSGRAPSDPSPPPPPSNNDDHDDGSFLDDAYYFLFGRSPARRAGIDYTTWYWTTVTDQEVDDLGLPQARVCLNVTQAQLTTLDKSKCSLATFDAHGTLADGGSVQVSIQQATTLTTTVSTERTTSAGESLSSTWSGGVELGYEDKIVAKVHVEYVSRPLRGQTWTPNIIIHGSSPSSLPTPCLRVQKANQSCYVELTTETCQSKLRLVTPITLSGKLHLQSSPYCQYNKAADGSCKEDLFIDLETAMKGFATDAVIIQYIDAALTSTGTYKQQCIDTIDDTVTPASGGHTNVTPTTPTTPTTPDATVTVYGHTATNFALTTTVAEKTSIKTVITDFFQPTVTEFKKTKDVATATVFTKTTTVTAADARKVTVTATRRPRASTSHVTSTVRTGVRTITEGPTTTTVVKRVTKTLKPTACRRALDGDDEEEEEEEHEDELAVRSVPTAAPVVKREAFNVDAGTTTLSDATTTVTDPVHPTTVIAIGSTTTVTSAVSGTKTLAAITVTDSSNTQFRFVTASAVSTKIVNKVTATKTVSRPANTSTVTDTVTRGASTKTVHGATVTVKKTRTSTVTPRCTRRP
ncbi:unnamed protein product [Tilletia controversa]|nr:unnamed protein product [Tilletia controversa]